MIHSYTAQLQGPGLALELDLGLSLLLYYTST